jgi:hypothetical protein
MAFFPKKVYNYNVKKEGNFTIHRETGGTLMEKENRLRAKVYAIELSSLWTMNKALLWLIMGFILLAIPASVQSQQTDQAQLAFNANAKSAYAKPVSRSQSQNDFNDATVSNRQTIDFFKNESNNLSKEISDLIEKVQPGKTSSIAADESDIVHVAILKNKLEYLEVILKKWINEGSF